MRHGNQIKKLRVEERKRAKRARKAAKKMHRVSASVHMVRHEDLV
jgi:hypothetical protein